MHTVLVIGVFAAMVLAPCVIASYSNFSPQGVTPEKPGKKAEPELNEAPARVPHVASSPLEDPAATRTR